MAALPGSAAHDIALGEGQLVTILELEVQRPGGAFATAGAAWAELPHGTPPGAAAMAADSDILRASDLGYVSRPTDAPASAVYVPTLQEGFACNRSVDLSPAGGGTSVAWGELRLASDDRRYDAGLIGRNADQRVVRILVGRKPMDRARGFFADPPYAQLAVLFQGLAQQWQADEQGLSIPVRDQSAWLERPYLQNAYGGTGGADGSADIAGRLKPRLRGGSPARPVRNIAPVLIDPVANVWQYTDGAGGIVQLFESGAAVFAYGGDTANLWAGSTAAGAYRTANADGLFQLGSPAAGQITADAWGRFPGAGAEPHGHAATAALRLLRDDMAMPAASYDAASFAGVDTGAVYEAGWYWDGAQQESCAAAVSRFLAAINCRLFTRRDGALACLALRAVADNVPPDASYGPERIVSLRRTALPGDVSPPLHRLRWGHTRNHTPMASGVNPAVAAARRQFLANADRFWTTVDDTVLADYRRPNDIDPVPTALLLEQHAVSMANAAMALWSKPRRLYSVELPVAYGLRHELGDVLEIAYPLDDLDGGRKGRVVGEQLRLSDATSALLVLV